MNTEPITIPLETRADDHSTTELTAPPPAKPLPRPRTRWGAILWGLILVTIAAFAVLYSVDAGERLRATEALEQVTPVTVGIVATLVVGVIILLAALASLGRRRD